MKYCDKWFSQASFEANFILLGELRRNQTEQTISGLFSGVSKLPSLPSSLNFPKMCMDWHCCDGK